MKSETIFASGLCMSPVAVWLRRQYDRPDSASEYIFKQMTDFEFTMWKHNQHAATDRIQQRFDSIQATPVMASAMAEAFQIVAVLARLNGKWILTINGLAAGKSMLDLNAAALNPAASERT